MVLNDAYFSIPIHHLHRKSLRFIWRNMQVLVLAIWSEISSSDLHQMYQTPNVIPQNTGSSESDLHRRFSLAMALALTLTQAQEICTKVLEVFQNAGFVINQQKSNLITSHKILFLVYLIETSFSTSRENQANFNRNSETVVFSQPLKSNCRTCHRINCFCIPSNLIRLLLLSFFEKRQDISFAS